MTETQGIEQWDLTSQVSPYLDRHMIFPLLEYLDTLIGKKAVSYSSKDVAAARLSLLRPTHMVDYAIDVYKSIQGDAVPAEMEEQKQAVYKKLEDLSKGCQPLDDLCKNKEERVSSIRPSSSRVHRLLIHAVCLLAHCIGSLTHTPSQHFFSFLDCRPSSLPLESGTWRLFRNSRIPKSHPTLSRPTECLLATSLIAVITRRPETCSTITCRSTPSHRHSRWQTRTRS